MATTVNYGNRFKDPIVVRPAIITLENLTQPSFVLNKKSPQIQLNAGIYNFTFTGTDIGTLTKQINGAGTIDVSSVIP